MNGLRIWALQDLSHLPAKSLQHETHVPRNTFKRCFSNFLNSSLKQDNAHKNRKVNLSTISNNPEPIYTTWTLPETTMTIFSSRSPTYFLPSKANTNIMRPLKPLIKYDELLDGNTVSRSKYYKMLPDVQAGDFKFKYNDNTVIKSDKVYYDTSKRIFTLQENKEPKIGCTIAQGSIDDLSICATAKNVNSSSPAKLELKTSEIKRRQSRDQFKSHNLQKHNESSGIKESLKSSSGLPLASCRFFSSKSCTEIQHSIQKIENLRNNLSANALTVRLRSTQSYSGRISLTKLRSFFSDASRSKRFADCEDDGSQEVARSRCRIEKKICEKSRRKDICDSSQDDACEEQLERDPCKSTICPELKRRKQLCSWYEKRCPEVNQKTDAKGRVSSRNRARRDSDCSKEKDIDTCRRQSKSYKRREDCEKSDEPRAVCKDSIKKNIDCESKSKKRCKKRDTSDKEPEKCTGKNRKRSNSCRRRNSSRASDKSCSKVDEKRRCSKDERDRKQGPSCEKRKRTCETKEKNQVKKKCVKSPANCMSRKKTTDKKTFCQSTQEDDKKFCESTKSTQKSNHEEFCTSRKKQFTKDKQFKKESIKACTSTKDKEKESVKAPPCTTTKDVDKMPKDQSIKQQIEREYKEIEECKKGFKKEKKDYKAKMVSIENKPTGLDRIISSCEKQQKDSEKFASTLHESIVSTGTAFKWFNIQSRIFNGKISIIAKDVRLFNVIFDRLFSTAKLDYQDDFAIERIMNHDKIAQNYSANSDDFVHGDELPNYVEIEYEDEEDDVHD